MNYKNAAIAALGAGVIALGTAGCNLRSGQYQNRTMNPNYQEIHVYHHDNAAWLNSMTQSNQMMQDNWRRSMQDMGNTMDRFRGTVRRSTGTMMQLQRYGRQRR